MEANLSFTLVFKCNMKLWISDHVIYAKIDSLRVPGWVPLSRHQRDRMGLEGLKRPDAPTMCQHHALGV